MSAAVRRLKMSDYRELVRMCEAQMEEVKEIGGNRIIIGNNVNKSKFYSGRN